MNSSCKAITKIDGNYVYCKNKRINSGHFCLEHGPEEVNRCFAIIATGATVGKRCTSILKNTTESNTMVCGKHKHFIVQSGGFCSVIKQDGDYCNVKYASPNTKCGIHSRSVKIKNESSPTKSYLSPLLKANSTVVDCKTPIKPLFVNSLSIKNREQLTDEKIDSLIEMLTALKQN